MPGINIGKSGQKLLTSMKLEELGTDGDSFEVFEMDEGEAYLYELAAIFKQTAQNELSAQDAISSNRLAQSITFDTVTEKGGVMSIEIKVAPYFDYVNKGVNGLKKNWNSPYQFRNMGVGKAMLGSLKKWIKREGLKVQVNEAKAKPLGAERKGKPFSELKKRDELEQAAMAIGRAIKANGLKPTRFWDKATEKVKGQMRMGAGTLMRVVVVKGIVNKGKKR